MQVALDVSAVPPRPAGAGRYILELAGQLSQTLASDLSLICQTGDARRWREAAPSARLRPVVPRNRLARLLLEQLRGPRWVEGAPLWHGPHYSLPLAYRRGPKAVTVHDLGFLEHPEWHEQSKVRYFGLMMPAALRVADAVFCESAITKRAITARFDVPEESIFVAPLGIDPARFQPTERAEDGAVASRFDITGPYVLCLGTTEPRKNLARVVRAFTLVADTDPEVKLAIVGQAGWKDTDVATELRNSPFRDRIVTLGYVADELLPALLRRSRALCYPSLYEGFGLPVLEALACGTIVVTTAGSVMAETAADAALLVDATSDVAVAAGIRSALTLSDGARTQLVARGLTRSAGYRWSNTADIHLTGYEHATRGWAARRPRNR